MDLKSIVSARIHPAIGIARVGNSREDGEDGYFVGPEVLRPVLRDRYSFRDRCGRLKRQAARFRVFGYDKDDQLVGELTAKDAEITWSVHVANTKAAWYDFDIALDLPEAANIRSPRRNVQIQGADRRKLRIDPGPASVSGLDNRSEAMVGRFFHHEVYLGELRTDSLGRLLFLGGTGKSGTPFPDHYPPSTFANNPCWHDDLCDGPVSAEVCIDGRRIKQVESAWVVATMPNFAPDLVANQTMYDVILDTFMGRMLPKPTTASFANDILPLFQHFTDSQWLNLGILRQFGFGGLIDFSRAEFLEALSRTPKPDRANPGKQIDPFAELRALIFNNFRNPADAAFQSLRWPPIFGDAYGNPVTPTSPRVGFAVTKTAYRALQQWASGNFVNDYAPDDPGPAVLEDVPLKEQPAMLDHAALNYCMGGPFHPAMEMSWPMRILSMYRGPFRLRRRAHDFEEPDYGDVMTQSIVLSRDGPLSGNGPGDITKWLGVPWQTDAASCLGGVTGSDFPVDDFLPAFWVSRVPNQVLTEEDFAIVADESRPLKVRVAAFHRRAPWLRNLKPDDPYVQLITRMVHQFGDLGVIERRDLPSAVPGLPQTLYVETLPEHVIPAESEPKAFKLNREARAAKFSHLQKRQT